MLESLISVLVGWLLGMSGGAGYDLLRERREVKRTRLAIASELQITITQLVATHFNLARRSGGVTPDLLEWLHPRLNHLSHLSEFSALAGAVRELRAADADDLLSLGQVVSAEESQTFPSLKQFAMPFLAANLEKLSSLPSKERLLGLELAGHLGRTNREIQFAWWLYEKTLDPSSMAQNADEIQANIDATLEHISIMTRRGVEMAERLNTSITA